MTAVEAKFAVIFALFFLAFGLKWMYGRKPQRWRRHRFWPPPRGQVIPFPERPHHRPPPR